jgi:hypothetical protein
MGAVAMVSLGAVRQAELQAEARQWLYEHGDQWLDHVERLMKEKPRTLDQVIQTVSEMRQDLLGKVAHGPVEQAS